MILLKKYIIDAIPLIALLCFYLLKKKTRIPEILIWCVYGSVFMYTLYSLSVLIYITLANPQVWDFTCFYLWGKAALAGYDFYQPEKLHLMLKTLVLPKMNFDSFVEEVVNVGFVYPPQSMFYFAPLGIFRYQYAQIIWIFFNLIFLLLDIGLVFQLFFRKYGLNGLILVATLFFVFSGSTSNIYFAQTNFITLFFLLLMRKYSESKSSGIFLTLAFFTKPYMLIFALYFVLLRKWSAVLYSVLSAVFITGFAALCFGLQPFISYFVDNPVSRLPEFYYSQDIGQSLYAFLLKSKIVSGDNNSIFYMLSSVLLIFSMFILYYLKKNHLFNHIWKILLLVGLLLYPITWSHYSVMLLFLLSELHDGARDSQYVQILNLLIFISIFYLSTYSFFASICCLLMVVLIKTVYLASCSGKTKGMAGVVNSSDLLRMIR